MALSNAKKGKVDENFLTIPENPVNSPFDLSEDQKEGDQND